MTDADIAQFGDALTQLEKEALARGVAYEDFAAFMAAHAASAAVSCQVGARAFGKAMERVYRRIEQRARGDAN